MIPWIKKHFPDITLIAGSTLDNDSIVEELQGNNPQLMPLQELEDLGVDGFISMLKWSEENIKKYSSSHLVIPLATSANEAYEMMQQGAHMVKIRGWDHSTLQHLAAPAVFGFCPTFVTGGMSPETIPEAVKNGASCIGSGFDLISATNKGPINIKSLTLSLKSFQNAVFAGHQASNMSWLSNSKTADKDWFNRLPFYKNITLQQAIS